MSEAIPNPSGSVTVESGRSRGLFASWKRVLALPFAFLIALGLQPFVGVIPAFAANCSITPTYSTIPTTATAGTAFSVTVHLAGTGGGGATCAGSVALSSTTDTHFTPPSSQTFSFLGSTTQNLTYSATLITAGSENLTASVTATTGTCTTCTASGTITVSATTADAASSTISTSSSSPTAGGTAPTITVTLKDGTAAHNLVSGKTVQLTGIGSNASPSPTNNTATTNTSGVATYTLSDTVAEGPLTVGATDTSDTVTLSTTVSITYSPGALDHFSVSASSPQTAGTSFALTATAQDLNNNTVTSFASTVSLSDSTDSGFSNPSTTAVSGVATFSSVVLHTAGSSTITATGSTKTGSVTITVNPGALSSFSFTSPGAQTAGTSFSLTVTAKDGQGNTKTDYTGTVVFSSATDSHASLPGNYTYVSGDSGAHLFSLTLNTAGSETVTVTDNTAVINTTSAAITVSAGSVSGSSSTIGSTGSPVTADGTTSITVTVTLKDGTASHNAISGKTVQISGLGASTPSPGTSTSTNSSGQAVFTITDTTAQTLSIGATDTTDSVTLSGTTSITFSAGAASAGHSSVLPSSQSVTADGATTATITVTVEDTHNNPVSGDSITLKATGGSSKIGGTAATTGVSATTNSSGIATFQTTDTTAEGPLTYSATDTTASNLVLGSATITFTAGAVSTGNSSVTGPVGSVLADGTTTGSITVTLKDANNNAISGATVQLQANTGSSLINNITGTTGTTATTSGTGVATFTVKDTAAESPTYTATDTTPVTPVTIGSVQVTFAPGTVSASQSTISPTSQSAADDGTTVNITVTVKDSHGNLISGDAVKLTANSGTHSLINGVTGTTGTTGTSNSAGQVTFAVGDTTGESVTYQASDTTPVTPVQITATSSVTFAAGLPSATLSTVVAGSSTSTVGSAVTVTVTLLDNSSTAVSGKTIKLTGTGSAKIDGIAAATGSTGTSPTNSSGQATFQVNDTSAEGPLTFTATDTTDGGLVLSHTAQITFQAGALSSFVFSGVPATVIAGSSFNVTITAKDTGGNTKTDYVNTSFSLTSSATNSPNATSPIVSNQPTFTAGVASAAVTFFNASESPTLTATDGTVVAHSVAIAVDPAAPQSPFFTVAPEATTQPASTAFGLTVTANADAYGNTGYLGTVHFTSNDTNAAVALPADYAFQPSDNGSHVFSVTLITVTSSNSATVTVTDQSNASIHASTPGIMVISAGAAVDMLLVKQTTQVAGNGFYVTVRADDGHGNTITTFTNKVTLWPCSETCDGKTIGNGPNFVPTGVQKPVVAPSTWIYKVADNGSHTFKVTFKQAGAQQLTAVSCDPRYANGLIGTLPSTQPCPGPSAASGGNVLGNTNVTVLPVNPVKLSIATNLPPSNPLKPTLPPVTTANVPFNATVNVLDKFGNIVTGNAVDSKTLAAVTYTHAVHFTSTDLCTTTRTFCAALPPDYTFTGTDNGSHTFSTGVTIGALTGGAALKTAGTKSIKVTDVTCVPVTTTCKPPSPGSKPIIVNPNMAAGFVLIPGTASTTTHTHNAKFTVTVKAVDAVLNIVKTYTGTVHVANAGADSATEPVCTAPVPVVSGVPQTGSCVPPADTTFLASYAGVHGIGIVLPNKSTVGDPNTTVTFSDSTNHITATATFVLS